MHSSVRNGGRWLLAGVMAILLGGLAGCEQTPQTYPVRGKVVFRDGKPWSGGGRITFQIEGDPASVATGEIHKDSTFTVETHYVTSSGKGKAKPGALAGEHTVTVEENFPVEHEGVMRIMPITVPKKYKVQPGDNQFVIEVTKGKR
jgi:hypothetical protein